MKEKLTKKVKFDFIIFTNPRTLKDIISVNKTSLGFVQSGSNAKPDSVRRHVFSFKNNLSFFPSFRMILNKIKNPRARELEVNQMGGS